MSISNKKCCLTRNVKECNAVGTSLVELLVVFGMAAFLASLSMAFYLPGCCALSVVKSDVAAALHQAKIRARASGQNITVAFGKAADASDVVPVHLPEKVKWGKLSHVPLPPGMAKPVHAAECGEAHAKVTITPRNTATASVWFLNDGKDVLCVRISNHCRYHMLRWRENQQIWKRED